MNTDLLKYLQQDGIGKVIAKGLADVYTHKPQAPVKYLAAWLKKYSNNQQEIATLSNHQKVKTGKVKQFQENVSVEKQRTEKKKSEEQQAVLELQNFKNKIERNQYQKDLLYSQFPQFIEKRLQLTGSYIGYVKHPSRSVTDEDEDENAHLDTTQPKMINYIGASDSHASVDPLVLGQRLPLDKGVTAGAFSLSLDDPLPAEDGSVEVKDKYVYIPNVVKNQNMHYFRLPKLGSYIAVPLVYQSYLTQHIFNVALEARLKYLQELGQFEKGKKEELKEIEGELQAIQQKLTEAKEKNDEAGIQSAKGELAEITKRKREKEEENFDEENTELPTEKKEFVVCGDTLGKDREISLADKNFLVDLVKHFRDSWEKKERELLYKDVNYQINIQKNQEKTPEAVIEHLQKCCEIPAESKASFDQIEDEQLREYRKTSWQLQALRKELREGQQYLASFFKLKNFRVTKFRSLIQTLLYFLSYRKISINQPSKTRLDWRTVRATYLYADTYFKLIDYNSQGPKIQQYPPYCKISHVSQNLEKYTENQVFKYNIGLGAILMLLKKQIAHRIANIQLRRGQKQKEREQRNLLLEQNEKIAEEKRQALEKHKQSLLGEDLEAFKEEEWSAKYDEENPLKQIPPQVVEDVDNDF